MRKAETDSQSIRSTSSSSEIALQAHAPLADWDALADSDHFVQFYEADDYLLDSLGGFIGTGLETDHACIVVATSEHRAGLEARLDARGLDVVAAATSGQYVSLDAAETLAQFMLGDAPDPARFTTIIENIIAQAAAGQRRVRIFGEMVALPATYPFARAKLHEITIDTGIPPVLLGILDMTRTALAPTDNGEAEADIAAPATTEPEVMDE